MRGIPVMDQARRIFDIFLTHYVFSLRAGRQDLWFQVFSDISIAAAHYTIVIVLLQVMLKRKDKLLVRVVALFAVYIGMRGTTQFLALWPLFHPAYQLGDLLRSCTALLSVVTAVSLALMLPQIHRLPSAADLARAVAERDRVEADLRVREARFRNFLESFQDYAIYQLDMGGIVRSWNAGGERIKGYTEKEIVGQHYSCFFTTEDIAAGKPEEGLRKVLENGKFEGEGWRLRKDGTRFWGHSVIRPMHDPSGKAMGFAKITRDLTASLEMEAKYRSLMEAAPDAVLLVNQQGQIEFANSQVEKLFGYPRAELLGQPMEMLTPRLTGGTASSAVEQANQLSGSDEEIRGRRKDGSEFPLDMSICSLQTKDGPVVYAAIRDVTERKLAEVRFRNLLDSAPDAMVIVNSDGVMELANRRAEEMFGYPRTELVGQPVGMLVPEEQRAGHRGQTASYFARPTRREMGVGLDLSARRKDGSLFPVEIMLSPLEGQDGLSVTAAIRDVSERKLAAERLAQKVEEMRHLNSELQQFAHVASHDLQEPLRMVASYTQLLAKRYTGRLDADADEFIGYAVDGTKRMKVLIEDLLAYSRTGKGTQPIEHFSSERPLKVALNNLHAAIQESGALVTFDALPSVTAVEAQLVQLFQNLIGNAIKYRGSRTPEVHIAAEAHRNEWVFSVEDNGIGIDPEYFERIFVIFQRLHGREEYEGTGIGLAICKRILQQQGGRIWVESSPGVGSTFRFSLPMR